MNALQPEAYCDLKTSFKHPAMIFQLCMGLFQTGIVVQEFVLFLAPLVFAAWLISKFLWDDCVTVVLLQSEPQPAEVLLHMSRFLSTRLGSAASIRLLIESTKTKIMRFRAKITLACTLELSMLCSRVPV